MRRICLLVVLICTLACNSKYDTVIDLDKANNVSISFQDLPEDVQHIYKEFVKSQRLKDTLVNRLNDFKIELYKPTLHGDQFGLIREGFNHIFVVDDSLALKLKANKGDPFVFYDSALFYTKKLNLDESNVKYSEYIRIDLDGILSME